jgi:hypothetical protein
MGTGVKKTKPCRVCVATSPMSRFPSHVVNARDGKPLLFDVRGYAVVLIALRSSAAASDVLVA